MQLLKIPRSNGPGDQTEHAMCCEKILMFSCLALVVIRKGGSTKVDLNETEELPNEGFPTRWRRVNQRE